MNRSELDTLDHWFRKYVESHSEGEGGLHFVQNLKFEHSLKVADDAEKIARDLGWSEDRVLLGRAVGLLHDTGRFSQFRQYGTFADHRSVDHGLQGCKVLEQEGILSRCPELDAQIILCAARYHNRRFVPTSLPTRALPYVLLVRDADKLDILRVVCETLSSGSHRLYPEILLQVNIEGEPNPLLIRQILDQRSGSYEHVRSLADMNLMRLTWVYSLYYLPSMRYMLERGFLNGLGDALPDTPEIRQIVGNVRRYAEERLRNPDRRMEDCDHGRR